MSLVKTLAKVAIGVAVAKGVSYVAKNGLPGGSGTTTARNPGRGTQIGGADDILGQIGGMLGGATSGTTASTRGSSGGLGSLIEGLQDGISSGSAQRGSTSTRRASAPKGLEDMLGGDLGGLLGGILGGAAASRGGAGGGMGGLGSMLDSILTGGTAPAQPTQEQELAAGLMLKAMIQAVKSDRQLDAAEKQKLMQALEGVSEQEVAFVNQELSGPVDIDGLVAQIPQGMEAQAYAVSLAAIDLDQQAEAEYLHALAQALDLQPAAVNEIHDRAGVTRIYR